MMFLISIITGAFLIVFQAICGSIALKRKFIINFSKITGLTIFLNIAVSIVGFVQLSNELQEREIRCGMPLAAYMLLVFFIFIILIAIIAIQASIKFFAGSGKLKNNVKRI